MTKNRIFDKMAQVMRLTRKGKLAEATALIQRTLEPQDHSASSPAQATRAPSLHSVAPAHPQLAGKQPLPDIPVKRSKAGKKTPAAPAGQWISEAHSNAAGTRAYKLYIPSSYQGQNMPLVVMLHGCTQAPDDFAAGTGMNSLAEAQGFLVAYPEQAASANGSRCWNWFQTTDQQRDRGEPALIAGITRQVMSKYHIDAGRAYVAGLSAGGAMAAIVAVTYPDLYTAVGVHSGLAPGSASDLPSAFQAMRQAKQAGRLTTRPIPLILFHGDRDSTVHPNNAEQIVRQWLTAAEEAPGQPPPRVKVRQGQVEGGRTYTCRIYPDPRGQTLVEQWTIHGAGHAWSGGSRSGSYTDPAGPNASKELVRFFQAHSRQMT